MTSFKTIPNHSHKVRSSGKKLNSHLLTNFNLDTILNQALQNTSEYLRQFRFDAGYTTKLETAFGSNFNRSVANQIFDKLAKGNFSDIPSIEIVNRNDINGANGAFAVATGKIYLSQEFITANAQNVNAIVAVLLEEYGHYVDSRINTKDAAGDEGDVFARLVQGKSISQQELAVLRAEDDSATVTLDGQVIQIEKNTNTLYGNFGNVNGTSNDDLIYVTKRQNASDPNEIYGGSNNTTKLLGLNLYNPIVHGRNGKDVIADSFWSDDLYGDEGNDTLITRRGSDNVWGGDGDDLLYASAYIDGSTKSLWGGAGSNTFVLDARGKTKTILNFNVEQLVEFSNKLNNGSSTKTARQIRDGIFAGLTAFAPQAKIGLSILSMAIDLGLNHKDAEVKAENIKTLLRQYPSDSWGQILTEGNRDIILIEDFKIGVDRIILPSLANLPGYIYKVSGEQARGDSRGRSSKGVYVSIEGLNKGKRETEDIAFIKAPDNFSTNNNNNMDFGQLMLDLIDPEAGIIGVFTKSLIEGSNGENTINGTNAYDVIHGFAGNDQIEGKLGNDTIDGGIGDDKLWGGFHQNPLNSGQSRGYTEDGDDFIKGGDGNDTIDGEYGNDIINGGNGNDELWGGQGSDVFLYDSLSYLGTDTIKDFNAQQGDKIFVSKSAFTDVILDKTKFSYNTATNTLGFNGKNLAVLNANSGFDIQQNLIVEAAEIFADSNYQGKNLTLLPGKYDLSDLTNNGFGNDTLSSLKVPKGWSVVLYTGAGYNGTKKVFTSNSSFVNDFKENFNDLTSSLVVADNYVDLFYDANYQGLDLKLAPGSYKSNDLMWMHPTNNFTTQISSLIIPEGWRVTLYDQALLNGNSKVFNSSTSFVGEDWDDRTWSLKIEAYQPVPVPALALTNSTSTGTTGATGTTGTSGNNNLVGGSGNDNFLGLGGQDTLTGGLGADKFRFNSPSEGMDTITDFSRTQGDKIELFAPGFNNMVWSDNGSTALASNVFSLGTSSNSWTNTIIYNNSNGIVYFDSDALGSAQPVALAQLSSGLNLTNQDFLVSWV
jgi:Ca2+-binding RTX toxin-like protein